MGQGYNIIRRDPREGDRAHYYRDWAGRLVKRTEWTADNQPDSRDGDALVRYFSETTPAQRHAFLKERMRRKGLVQWHDSWVTPERAKELEKRFQEGLKRSREIQIQRERSQASRGRLWYWC